MYTTLCSPLHRIDNSNGLWEEIKKKEERRKKKEEERRKKKKEEIYIFLINQIMFPPKLKVVGGMPTTFLIGAKFPLP